MKRNGVTLLEMVLVTSMLVIVMTSAVGMYLYGATAWKRADMKSELLRTAVRALSTLERELQNTSVAGFSSSGSIAAFMKPEVAPGVFRYEAYVLYWLDAASLTLMRSELPLPPGSPLRLTPDRLERMPPEQPLAAYTLGGQEIATRIEAFEARREPGARLVQVRLLARRPADGELVELRSAVCLQP